MGKGGSTNTNASNVPVARSYLFLTSPLVLSPPSLTAPRSPGGYQKGVPRTPKNDFNERCVASQVRVPRASVPFVQPRKHVKVPALGAYNETHCNRGSVRTFGCNPTCTISLDITGTRTKRNVSALPVRECMYYTIHDCTVVPRSSTGDLQY